MRKIYLILISTCLIFPGLSLADNGSNSTKATTQAPATTPASSILPNDLNVTGYLDGSYNYLQNRNKFISGVNDRVFDLATNGFTLQQAAITLAYQPPQGFGALLNLIMGRDAITTAPYDFKPITEFDSQTFSIDFTQAYLQYTKNCFTVIAGRFVSPAGAEVINPTQDTNFSRSILDGYAEPFTHTGIRGTYTANDKLKLIAGINNGWDNISDWSRRKTIELGLAYTMNTMFSLAVLGYNGQERATPDTSTGPEGIRTLIDLVATLNATDKLTFIANYDYAWQTTATLPTGTTGRAVWTGIAGYANYKFNDRWRASLRGEYFDDQDGYRTGVRQNWKEVTLTVGYAPLKPLEFRLETRRDFSNVKPFVNSSGSEICNYQQSYALEGIYKFG